MKRTFDCTPSMFRLLSASGAVLLGVCGPAALHAQQPVLNAATRATLHRSFLAQEGPAAGTADPQSPPNVPQPPAVPSNMKDDLFAGTERFAKGATDVTEVNMDPDSLSMVSGSEAAKAHRTVWSVVRTYTYDKPGMYNMADVDEYRRKLDTGDWHCSVHTRDMRSGESTDVCSKRRGTDMVEHAIITVSPKSLTFIHNIRRANGQGGHMERGEMPGMSFLGGSLGAELDTMGAETAAEMLAGRAEMQARTASMLAEGSAAQAELQANLGQMQAGLARMEGLQAGSFSSLDPEKMRAMQQEMEQHMRALQGQLDNLNATHQTPPSSAKP